MKISEIFEDVFGKDNPLATAINKATMLGNEYAKSQQELSNVVSQIKKEGEEQKTEAENIKKEREQLDKEKAKFADIQKKEQIKKAQAQALINAQNQAKQVATQVDLAMKENK